MKHFLLSFLLITAFQFSFSQDFILKGKIVSQSESIENITVYNKSKTIGTFSDSNGYFNIKVAVGDSLLFSAIHLKIFKYKITVEDSTKTLLYFPMESRVNVLDDITVTEYKSITPESLRIIPSGMKIKTPVERRLYTAGKFKWYSPLLIPLGGMDVDGMINAISGRTAMLKKELEIEKKTFLIDEIKLDYDKKYLIEKLNIPEDYAEGFYFYLVDQPRFKGIYKGDDKIQCEFELAKLAVQYLEIIKSEEKRE